MSTLFNMDAVYDPSPQVARTTASPDSAQVEQELIAGMSALRSHDGDAGSQRAYVPSQWSACLGSQAGSDDFDNYALHNSPTMTYVQHHENSAQSSPRCWDSPEQLGPTPWEAATEQLHNQYPGLDPRLSGAIYLPGNLNNTVPTSYPTDPVPFVPSQSFDGSQIVHQRGQSPAKQSPVGYQPSPKEGSPFTSSTNPPESRHPLSPWTTATLGLSTGYGMPSSPSDRASHQAAVEFTATGHRSRRPPRARARARGATHSSNGKEEPYAKLIYRAFLSTPRRAMTLQEIYQWFRENTDKGKTESKGWQNSIRHNLSMNMAFTKRERKLGSCKDGDAESGYGSGSQSDGRKVSEWYLEPWAAEGVQSTTKYRKHSSRRRTTSYGGFASGARIYRSYFAPHPSSRRTGIANGILAGRTVRSARQAFAAASSRSNTGVDLNAGALQPYHFSPPPQQHLRQPYISHLLDTDPSNATSPYGTETTDATTTPSFFARHSPQASQTGNNTMDFGYPDPQLFSIGGTAGRASSEPGGAALDMDNNEPVTPEPASYGDEAGMVPGPRGVGYRHHHQQQLGSHENQHTLSSAYPALQMYDEMVDRYQGWDGPGPVVGMGNMDAGEMDMSVEGVFGLEQGYSNNCLDSGNHGPAERQLEI
ncbi:uncharacterized protein B0T15DRAFT_2462 [Chaetomium strumarium]|uniref:Fork-head domain-containing protein n=1 Tax=Chaetomium strumarium TaxID=1170767 RepID=A0AAJ0H073_9PEZI|nr:hypothetical protein B0T15DRAFT_2462 [Chaetomium strumarium]